MVFLCHDSYPFPYTWLIITTYDYVVNTHYFNITAHDTYIVKSPATVFFICKHKKRNNLMIDCSFSGRVQMDLLLLILIQIALNNYRLYLNAVKRCFNCLCQARHTGYHRIWLFHRVILTERDKINILCCHKAH